MGLLVDGEWHDEWYDTKSSDGRFVRSAAQFRNWITADGSAGASGRDGFIAEAGRYHLYVSHACPWAHRTVIFRRLKGLESMIPLSIVHWYMAEQGWSFAAGDGVVPDPINQADYMHQVYTAADPAYSGRVTVPVLWDTRQDTIVSNESSEIIRMFNSAFDGIGAKPGDYYPAELRAEIGQLNERIYHTVNNGVYRCGFATSQSAYDEAVAELFETLDFLEQHLAGRDFLVGDRATEADWRLFTTLVRFDAVYYSHFKCNLRRIRDYPRLHGLLRRLYEMPGVSDAVNMTHIKSHYFGSHRSINPTGIVPRGPLDPI